MNTYLDTNLIMSQAALISGEDSITKNSSNQEMRKACQQFEAILIQTLYKGMKSTVPEGGLLEKNTDQEIFEEMMFNEVAQQTARHQSVGIAEALYKSLRKNEGK